MAWLDKVLFYKSAVNSIKVVVELAFDFEKRKKLMRKTFLGNNKKFSLMIDLKVEIFSSVCAA